MRNLKIPAVVFLCTALVGCATTDPGKQHTHEVRGEYVAAVERVAEKRGVTVLWINPPTRQRVRELEYSTQITVEREP